MVFAGTGAIVVDRASGGAVTHVGIALTFGLIVLTCIYAFGPVSGAHLNPAVTLALVVARRFPWSRLLVYWVSQLVGAFAASGLLHLAFPEDTSLGSTIPVGSVVRSFALEFLLTGFLLYVILSVADSSVQVQSLAGIIVGAVIGLEALFAGPICGASMNPARSIAPGVVSGANQNLWLYVVAPLLGALAGTIIYLSLNPRGDTTMDAKKPRIAFV